MGFLRKYIFANAGMKVLALAISSVLWVTYTAEPYAEVGFQVPLEFTTMPSQLEISGDVPTAARVRVRGRSVLLRRMVAADLNLRIDLKNATEGTRTLRLTPDMVRAPYGAAVVQVSPQQIQITLVSRREASSPTG